MKLILTTRKERRFSVLHLKVGEKEETFHSRKTVEPCCSSKIQTISDVFVIEIAAIGMQLVTRHFNTNAFRTDAADMNRNSTACGTNENLDLFLVSPIWQLFKWGGKRVPLSSGTSFPSASFCLCKSDPRLASYWLYWFFALITSLQRWELRLLHYMRLC